MPSDDDQSGLEPPPLCLTDPPSPDVFLQSSKSDLTLGQTFSVRITANIDEPVVSFGFHLDYDTTRLTLLEIDVAPRFSPLHAEAASEVAALAYPRPVEGDNVLLAVARFTARALGRARIDIDTTPDDPREGFAYRDCGIAEPNSTPVRVTVQEPPPPRRRPPVPEPATVTGVLSAFLLLGRRRRSPG
jgi:hypothetical protein